MSFSIVIPTMNEEERIDKLLEDIKKQTMKPEMVIVADKSIDNTPKIATRYGAILVEGVNDYHIGKARNNAAKIIQSEFIIFLDADNRLPNKRYFEEFIFEFKRLNADLAHSILIPDNLTIFNKIAYTFYNWLRQFSAITGFITSDVGSGLAMKREVFHQLKGFREDLANNEDIELLTRAMRNKYKYRILKTKIITSDRRLNNKTPLELAKFMLAGVLITLMVRVGFSSQNKFVKSLERIYWK